MSTRSSSSIMLGILLLGCIAACGSAESPHTSTIPTATTSPPTESLEPTSPPPTVTQELPSPSPTTLQEPTSSPEPYVLPLSGFDLNFIGKRTYSFVDTSRNDRPISITVWYPAIKPQDFTGTSMENTEPDPAGVPYPMILSSTKVAGFFAQHLVTHGFAVVSVNKLDTYDTWDTNLIDQPLEILFALDQVASTPLEGLEGMLDYKHAGAMGYSFDGYNALAMSGARVDPAFFLSQCADPESEAANIFPYSSEIQSVLINQWESFAAHAGETITTSYDGLWQPMTDERIRAVMPLAPDGWLLFGKHRLGAVDHPVLIIVHTKDRGTYQEDSLIYENLGTPDRFPISFVGKDHMMIYNPEMVDRMKHFAVAFFSTYLMGRQEYAKYFSEDLVSQYPDLKWGISSKN